MGAAAMSVQRLCALLRAPETASALTPEVWTGVLTIAHAERLRGSLAVQLHGLDLPADVQRILDAAAHDAEAGRTHALWEAEMARRALSPLGVRVVLLKGTAYVAAGLRAGAGRLIGDLDILVPRDALDDVEAALRAAGWDWVKPDAYDDIYYRRWMHELPPLMHQTRERMIDVHHTILPLTARPKPDAARLIADAVPLNNGLFVLSPAHMIVHAAAHLIADGELDGGLRNLWDIDQLVREFLEQDPDFCLDVIEEAYLHQLGPSVERALRLAAHFFGTPLKHYTSPSRTNFHPHRTDRLFIARACARDGWGRGTRPLLRAAFYIRSHLLRMPLRLLIPHLWRKWRRR